MKNIIITGGSGLVGSAIQRTYGSIYKHFHLYYLSSNDCDLTNYEDSYNFIKQRQPHYVIHLAAYVGGLYKNMNEKVAMIETNTLINLNLLKICYELKVKKVISCLSTCIFPDKIKFPIDETKLHNGPPHSSNEGYAYSKRLLETLSRCYNAQYNTDFICIIPTNIYGKNDNFNLKDAHVIPALIHKAYISKKNNIPFTIRGTGKPLRQFIFSEDLAILIMWCLEKYNDSDSIILADSKEYSIKEISMIIANYFNIGHIEFNSSFTDGQYKKTADNAKLMKLNPFQFTTIEKGIKETCLWFEKNYDNCRK